LFHNINAIPFYLILIALDTVFIKTMILFTNLQASYVPAALPAARCSSQATSRPLAHTHSHALH
jgi:hypothetical protein